MPTYQYACTACGHQLEAVQSFTDAPLTECPSCEGRLRKLYSSVGVVFKGSGFYRTDSRAAATNSPYAARAMPPPVDTRRTPIAASSATLGPWRRARTRLSSRRSRSPTSGATPAASRGSHSGCSP